MELPRSTGKVGTQQRRRVVGLPMMVLALVIGKGNSNEDEGCSDKINNNDNGRFDSSWFFALRGDFSIIFPTK
jgi:hypothetical protein